MMIYDDIISGKKQEVGKKRGGSELILGDNSCWSLTLVCVQFFDAFKVAH